jgi:hypothetical protein
MTTRLAPATIRRGFARRRAYAALAVLLLTAIAAEVLAHDAGYWQLAVWLSVPDLPLLLGIDGSLAQGQLHPRATRAYNLTHRFWPPLLLLAVAGAGVLSVGFLVGALAWTFHLALDRALGYGLRTADGFQRQ